MLRLLCITYFCAGFSSSFIVNYEKTKVLIGDQQGDFFGYSVLLQKGNPPIAIVGAPKAGPNANGIVYKCNLDNLKCDPYKSTMLNKGVYVPNKNGFLLGASLDGDDLAGNKYIVCAPRLVTTTSNKMHYVQIGHCFLYNNSTDIGKEPDPVFPMRSVDYISNLYGFQYYDAAYAQAGFDVKYKKDDNECIFGAPGKAKWAGASVITSLSETNWGRNDILQEEYISDDSSEQYSGYAVSSGKFNQFSSTTWYVAGSPRGSVLKGHVDVYAEKIHGRKVYIFIGEEYGSYFGASLLVLQKKNGGDDLVIGAPMHSGASWEEGRVYYYKNKLNGQFEDKVVLQAGNPKSGARFGTVIADLGDIDLNKYPDIAISAPYEDSGAVYLFYGSAQGFNPTNSHRITPSLFETHIPKAPIRGFGSAISRGNDIDGNLHNDFAVGAYRSSQVFFFTSYDLIDVKYDILPEMNTIYTITQHFNATICVAYTVVSKKTGQISLLVSFQVEDDRVVNSNPLSRIVHLQTNKPICFDETILLKPGFTNTNPMVLKVEATFNGSNDNFWFEQKEKMLELPVVHGCGKKVECHVDLSLSINRSESLTPIIFGIDSELHILVHVENSGEPAFQSLLEIESSKELTLINLRECHTFSNGSYICSLDQITNQSSYTNTFSFDLSQLEPETDNLSLKFKVMSSGRELNPGNNVAQLNIPVVLTSSPYVEFKSAPEAIFLDDIAERYEIIHEFTIGNEGPGPMKINFTLFVPGFLQIENVEAIGLNRECEITQNALINVPQSDLEVSASNNNLSSISCRNHEICTRILCYSTNYHYKHDGPVAISVKMLLDLQSEGFVEADAIVVTSLAFLHNVTDHIFTPGLTTIYGLSTNKPVPVWIYIVSIVSGLILLGLCVLVLYKLNFFQRVYKEKLQNEQGDMILPPDDEEVESETVFD